MAQPLGRLANRKIYVAGASSGIGLAIASTFARLGAHVAISSRTLHKLEDTRQKLLEEGAAGEIYPFQIDSRDMHSISAGVKNIRKKMQPIDTMVYASGIVRDALLMRMRQDDIENVFHTNVLGAIHTSKEVLRDMLTGGCGRIILIGSAVGTLGQRGQSVYAASKAALEGFARSLAAEVADRNISVNVVAPGFVNTGMYLDLSDSRRKQIENHIPMQRPGEVEEVCDAVTYLATTSYITGQVIHVDGGATSAYIYGLRDDTP